MVRKKRLNALMEFRLMLKKKSSHLKRPQMHVGSYWGKSHEYMALSDSAVVELRDWLSRYINEFVDVKADGEIVRASRIHANQIAKNMNKLESAL